MAVHPRPLLCGGCCRPLVLLCISRGSLGLDAVGTQLAAQAGVSCALRLQLQLCLGLICVLVAFRFACFCFVTHVTASVLGFSYC